VVDELDTLADLDPDDPRPASQQIANALRAAIRTRKFAPGERLPSQPELATRYQVARETVKSALRILRDERLIVTRQGSGAFVRAVTERPVGLRPHVENAFSRPHVTVDFAGFSGETLHGVLSEPLDKIRLGRLTPESITVRMLLPDTSAPMALPRRADIEDDDPAVRQRAERIARRHTEAIVESVRELGELGLVNSASAEVRLHKAAPLFKLYILNGEDAFFGFYPVLEHTVTIKGVSVPIYDPMGKDATLFHRTVADDGDTSDGAQYVAEAKKWFESMWTTIAKESVT
jgi:DNA-binding transcriptional regulator YhcF (GntR family)